MPENMIMNQKPQATLEPPTTSTPTVAGSEDPLRAFVSLLTVQVLTECNAFKNRSQEEWVPHTKRLVSQTVEGLALHGDVCPSLKKSKKISKAVLRDLQRQIGGKSNRETVLLLQDPDVDKLLIRALQVNIKAYSARRIKRDSRRDSWEDVVKLFAIATVTIAAMFLLLLIL